MTRPWETWKSARRMLTVLSLLSMLIAALPGCHYSFPFLTRNEFGNPLPADATKAEIIARVNDNIAKIHSWQSTDVHISGGGTLLPMRISAKIAVEAPRNFRLNATTPFGEEADFGSNDQQFWFWVKRSDMPYVFLASHEQVGRNEMLRQIPFQPDWLMEVLGVMPLNEEEFELEFDDTAERTAQLTSVRMLPSGQPVRRVIHVDTRYGKILQQSLYNMKNEPIAKAHLNKHVRDEATGAILPRLIQIEWPQPAPHQPLKLNIEIGKFEINPSHMPSQIWEVPQKHGYQTVNLDAQVPQHSRGHYGHSSGDRFADSTFGPSREPLAPLPRERDRFVMPVQGEGNSRPAGKVRLNDFDERFDMPQPNATVDENLPEWAREPIPDNKPIQRTPSTPQF